MHAFLLLDKPTGITSNAALSRVKRIFKTKSAGFAGTLDPMATGLLPIALGEATKCLPYIEDVTKTYEFTVRWGIETDTLDAEGVIVNQQTSRPAGEEAIQNIIPQFMGEITQIPPAYSAIKINGQRAYDLARAGEAPEMKPRTVTIHSLELLPLQGEEDPSSTHLPVHSSTLRVTCSKGTYIRSLARDMAYALGTLGHLTALRRTAAGKFSVSDAIPLEKLLEMPYENALQGLMPIRRVLDDIPEIRPDLGALQRLRQGQPITAATLPPGTHVLLLEGEAAFGIGIIKEDNRLWPRRIFHL
jgi:tRNA pseudouridine55 synthase